MPRLDHVVDFLLDLIARASRMAEMERAEMTQQILREALPMASDEGRDK